MTGQKILLKVFSHVTEPFSKTRKMEAITLNMYVSGILPERKVLSHDIVMYYRKNEGLYISLKFH